MIIASSTDRRCRRYEPVFINGNSEAGRDFCFVDNAIYANLPAALIDSADPPNRSCNIAVVGRTSLNELRELLRTSLAERFAHLRDATRQRRGFREADVQRSLAGSGNARERVGYVAPAYRVREGLAQGMTRHLANAGTVPAEGVLSVAQSRQSPARFA